MVHGIYLSTHPYRYTLANLWPNMRYTAIHNVLEESRSLADESSILHYGYIGGIE